MKKFHQNSYEHLAVRRHQNHTLKTSYHNTKIPTEVSLLKLCMKEDDKSTSEFDIIVLLRVYSYKHGDVNLWIMSDKLKVIADPRGHAV
jgi:hypothetical protein